MTAVIWAALASPASASPDCSNIGPKPSAECAAKREMCFHDSVVYVLGTRNRADGLSEEQSFEKLTGKDNHEVWYVKHAADVRQILHSIYSDEKFYRRMREAIAPSMAMILAKLSNGCMADTSLKIDPP
jgi:hypothetical protein